MKSIQRYDLVYNDLEKFNIGDYVYYNEHLKVVNALKSKIKKLKSTIEDYEERVRELTTPNEKWVASLSRDIIINAKKR